MTDEITPDEYEQRLEETETNGKDEEIQLLTFSELLELREDLSTINDQLDTAGGYWAQAERVLEQQAEEAQARGEDEKCDALQETADLAREVVSRIDGGEHFFGDEDE